MPNTKDLKTISKKRNDIVLDKDTVLDAEKITYWLRLGDKINVAGFGLDIDGELDNSKCYANAIAGTYLDNVVLNVSNKTIKELDEITIKKFSQVQDLKEKVEKSENKIIDLDTALKNDKNIQPKDLKNTLTNIEEQNPNTLFSSYLQTRKHILLNSPSEGVMQDALRAINEKLSFIDIQNVQNNEYKNYQVLNAEVFELKKQQYKIEYSSPTDHIISLYKHYQNDNSCKYIILDTMNYDIAHQEIEKQLLANNEDDIKKDFLIIPTVYSNGANNCGINSVINTLATPKVIDKLSQEGKEINAQNIKTEMQKFKPTQKVIDKIRSIDNLERYSDVLTSKKSELQQKHNNNQNLINQDKETQITKVELAFCGSSKEDLIKSARDEFNSFIDNPTKKNKNDVPSIADLKRNTLNELIDINNNHDLSPEEKMMAKEEAFAILQASINSLTTLEQEKAKSSSNIQVAVIDPENITLEYLKGIVDKSQSEALSSHTQRLLNKKNEPNTERQR